MTATILLVRHAAHGQLGTILSGRTPAIPLSEAGRAQAAALAKLVAGRFDRVETSPVERARETAAALAGGAPIAEAGALDEIDFGAWTGQPFTALDGDERWTMWNERRAQTRAPGGESMTEAQARAVAHVEKSAAAGNRIAMVTHCDIIRAVVAHYLDLSLDRLLRFAVDVASVTTLEVGRWGGRLVRLNEVAA